jgi:phage terminase small subunit
MQLGIKKAKFVEEYLASGNATEAAKRAGYSRKTAKQSASRLLKDPVVSVTIHEKRQAICAEYQLSRGMLVRMLLDTFSKADSALVRVQVIRELARLSGLYPGQCNCNKEVM